VQDSNFIKITSVISAAPEINEVVPKLLKNPKDEVKEKLMQKPEIESIEKL
jgi:hypothetical protein